MPDGGPSQIAHFVPRSFPARQSRETGILLVLSV
jgi:hypothetical protein